MSTCSLLNGFREILLNSINHKQYEENNPIQISIYDDKMYEILREDYLQHKK